MEDINIKALETIEKAGKGAAIGEIRVWGGKEYVKTPKGWRPKPKGYKESETKETTPITGNAREDKFVPLFGGNEGRIIDTKPNGDLIVEYRRKGEKNWTDIVKVGSDDYKNLTDSWGSKDNKHPKFEDRGGGKFELEIPGKGGAQISEGDGKFEVKVWDENYKYITDDSKRHVFDSKSEAEDFARILLNKK